MIFIYKDLIREYIPKLTMKDLERFAHKKNIEYTMGRTGILTPVAIFDPVDDGDSIIERASLHNLNIMKEVLGENAYENQKIWVSKDK